MRGVLGIDKDKVSRASYLDSQFVSGNLYLPRDLPLVDGVSLEAELGAVPNGRHDDRMDALCFASALADATFSTQPKVRIKSF
jgi:phage terminase large subunit-like protein